MQICPEEDLAEPVDKAETCLEEQNCAQPAENAENHASQKFQTEITIPTIVEEVATPDADTRSVSGEQPDHLVSGERLASSINYS